AAGPHGRHWPNIGDGGPGDRAERGPASNAWSGAAGPHGRHWPNIGDGGPGDRAERGPASNAWSGAAGPHGWHWSNIGDGGPVTTEVSIGARVRELAAERPDEVVFVFVAIDGREQPFTWPELDRRSGQLAGALAERGLGYGDRLGIGLRNSSQ